MEPLVAINPSSPESINVGSSPNGIANASSGAYPASNRAIFIPFYVSKPTVIINAFAYNGATASGNLDIGIYDIAGTKLVSTGSTAQTGTNAIQTIALTSTEIGPGVFYLAIAMDNTTGTLFRQTFGVARLDQVTGIAQMASAFTLPATATFASVASDFVPLFGISTRSVV